MSAQKLGFHVLLLCMLVTGTASGQSAAEQPALQLTLQDALARARQNAAQLQVADIAAKLAHEDAKQARAASLPTVNGLNQFIYTEGNGTPSGVFVANDGVHVYNEQLQAHEELLSLVRRGEIRLAAASEAVARAKLQVAARGLNATVIQDFYLITSAEKRLLNSNTSLDEARRFLDITRKQQERGEVARADTIKAQLQVQQRERDRQDAGLAVERARIGLAVLLFPHLRTDFVTVDDTVPPKPLSMVPEGAGATTIATPDLLAARAGFNEAKAAVNVARYAYLPSLGLDVFYGIDANQFTDHTDYLTPESGRSTLPNYLVPGRQNLGYSAQATLNIPLWNWGATHSKLKQAELRQHQAQLELSATEKQVQADLHTAIAEAQTAFGQIESLRSSQDLAAESLRLTLLRYQAAEATALEVSDAQTTASQARGAYDDGLVRYGIATATLQNLMGTL